jgi:hypothetical protein
VPAVVAAAEANIAIETESIQWLSKLASQHPYYRFNYAWNRQMESSVSIASESQRKNAKS